MGTLISDANIASLLSNLSLEVNLSDESSTPGVAGLGVAIDKVAERLADDLYDGTKSVAAKTISKLKVSFKLGFRHYID